MTKAPTPTEMSKGQSDNTNNATKKLQLSKISKQSMLITYLIGILLCHREKQASQRVTYCTPEYIGQPLLSHWLGWPSRFSDQPEKYKFGRGRCDLAYCQVSLNSVGGFREVENISANQRSGGHLCFPIAPKSTSMAENVDILLPVKFR